ncbi:probable prolyl 4-hydroxylase 3 [Rhodamnia argentea]|uniref:Probable prolyl 4-hydroxylase 3 n=1 Tax=Rhodamnia argentea TaxID=178133 RepID=A0A8B8P9F6_9MYRT|nr:probable prolyl 4-hydroxylase 3 [Rhodamnia argentea]
MRHHMIGSYVQFPRDFARKALFWPDGGLKMAKGKVARVQARGASKRSLALTLLLSFTVVLLFLLALGIVSLPVRREFSPREGPTPVNANSLERVAFGGLGERGKQWTQVLSWEPRAFLYHNFLSREECEYLVSLAKPRISKSTVVDGSTGKSMDSGVRTSSGMFLNRGQDKIVRAIEKRIADFTHIPVEHGEGLQILQYGHGQKYDAHHDYFSDPFNTRNGGQRMATMLMYLSDVEEGGETVFPAAKANFSAVPWWNDLSECGKQGLSVKPKMGNAVLFWSMKPDGTLDPASLHGACPVIKGTKWSAPKWMHVWEYKV